MKRFLLGIVMIGLLSGSVSGLEISGRQGIVMDGDSGIVLWEKDADSACLIASTTKIMTAIVVLEQTLLREVVTVPREAVGVEGSSMYLVEGEKLTVEDLLYGLMLSSGNDAAVALACHVAGNPDDFVKLMNEKAAALSLEDTSFANPHGLDDRDNFASPQDLARLTAYCLKNPDFRDIVSSKSYRCGNRRMTNHNKLLWDYPGALGVKTGYTRKAGRILVSAAQQNGRMLIAVTMSAPDDWRDHARLLDYGFSQYVRKPLLEENSPVVELAVAGGWHESVTLVATETLEYPLLEKEEITCQVNIPPFVYAPIEAGARLGSVTVVVSGRAVGECDLVAKETVLGKTEEDKGLFSWIFG